MSTSTTRIPVPSPRPSTGRRHSAAALAALVAGAVLLVGCGNEGGDDRSVAPESEGRPIAEEAAPDQDTAGAGGPAAACAAELRFRGTTYTMTGPAPADGAGRSLGDATVPPCADTPGVDPGEAATTAVFAVPGQPVEQVLVADGATWTALP